MDLFLTCVDFFSSKSQDLLYKTHLVFPVKPPFPIILLWDIN